MIQIHSLHKSFEGRTVLNDINHTFEDGKTNLIIGQSGSGKTVLMKCLVGLLTPEEGEVLYFMAGDVVPSPLNDEDTDNWANDNGYVAITPQDLDNTHWGDFENLKTIF